MSKEATKNSSNHLYELIKNLTPSEKRYFKLYVSKNAIKDGSNYLKLFNLYDQQTEFHESAIKTKIKNTSLSSQYSVTKHYLYNHILKSLELYNYQKTTERKLRSLRNQMEILYTKTLYTQAQKLQSRALQLAEANEKHTHVIDLLFWQARLLLKKYEHKDLNKRLESVYNKLKVVLDKVERQADFNLVDSKMLILIKKYGLVRDDREAERHKKVISNPILNDHSTDSFWEQYYHHHVYSLYFYAIEDAKKSYDHRKALMELFENSPDYIEDNKAEYIAALNNYIIGCQQLKKVKEFKASLKKLLNIKAPTVEDQIKITTNVYTLELLDYHSLGDFKKVIAYTAKVNKHLDDFGHRIDLSNRVMFYFILAVAHLAMEKYESSMEYFRKLINTPRSEEIRDLYRFSRILSLIVHYELGNDRLMESQIQSTSRYLKGKKKLFKMETVILNMLNQLNKLKNPDDEKAILETFAKELDEVLKDPLEKKALAYFNFKSWAESKLKGKVMGA